MSTPERFTALLDAFQLAWSGPSAVAFGEALSPDAHYEDPLLQGPLRGPERVAQHAARMRVVFPDLVVEIVGDPMVGGTLVAQSVRLRGTQRASLGRVPSSDKPVDLHAIVVAELATSQLRLARVRIFLDRYEGAIQMGLLPRERSLAERALITLRGFGIPRLP